MSELRLWAFEGHRARQKRMERNVEKAAAVLDGRLQVSSRGYLAGAGNEPPAKKRRA